MEKKDWQTDFVQVRFVETDFADRKDPVADFAAGKDPAVDFAADMDFAVDRCPADCRNSVADSLYLPFSNSIRPSWQCGQSESLLQELFLKRDNQ